MQNVLRYIIIKAAMFYTLFAVIKYFSRKNQEILPQ